MLSLFQGVLLSAALIGLALALAVLAARSRTVSAVLERLLTLWRSLTHSGRVAAVSLLTICVLYGGSKTNLPPRMMMRPAAPVQLTYAEKKAQNWNIRGAWRDSFWLKFADGWRFPFGTNHLYGVEVISFGQLWPTPFNTNAVASLGSRVEIVPGLSSFGYELTPSNSYRFMWGSAAINRDTNDLVTASLELFRNGDIAVTTNGVAKYIPRELPADWGDPSADDFYGNDNTLPDEADEGAYYWIDLVVSNAAAKVTFNGDKPSNYEDPEFVANNDSTNRVTLLIGKPYTVTCDEAIEIVAKSSDEIVVTPVSENEIDVVWPVEFDMMQNAAASYALSRSTTQVPVAGGFSITSFPFLNGYYVWDTNVCCNLVSNKVDGVWNYSCNANCSCMGCSFGGAFHYEGYWLEVTGASCGCSYREEPSATAGISFAGAAVIFENCYTNAPNDIVPRRSTTNSLNISVYGGPYGGVVEIEFDDNGKLEYLTSDEIPRSFSVAPGETVTHSLPFIAKEESATENDISASLVFTEYVSGNVIESEDEMTSVRVEVEADAEWPTNRARHVFGPQENMTLSMIPAIGGVRWNVGSVSRDGSSFNFRAFNLPTNLYSEVVVENQCFWFNVSVIAPTKLKVLDCDVSSREEWYSRHGYYLENGEVAVGMIVELQLLPLYVSFANLYLQEGSCPASDMWGFFGKYPVALLPHETEHGSRYEVGISNVLNHAGVDFISACFNQFSVPFEDGGFQYNITNFWYVKDAGNIVSLHPFSETIQTFTLYENGDLAVQKFDCMAIRGTNNVSTITKEGE